MKAIQKITIVSITFVLAAATGHVMQNPMLYGLESPHDSVQQADALLPGQKPGAFEAQGRKAVPDMSLPAVRALPGVTGFSDALPPATEPRSPRFGLAGTACAEAQLHAAPAAQATLALDLSAPCHGGEPAVIVEAGLSLPITLSPEGAWRGDVPALAEPAEVQVVFADGTTVATMQAVTGLDAVNRLAVIAPAPAGLVLSGQAGEEGLSVFEGAGRQVQIYTAPAGRAGAGLAITAGVSGQTCGQDLQAEARRWLRGTPETPVEITVAMPECDGIGGAVRMPLPDFPVSVAVAN